MNMFPLASAAPQAAIERAIYAEHLQTLKERFERYFPRVADIEDNDWIRDPFNQESESSTEKLTMKEREESAELRADRTLKLKFSELTLDQFWLVCASEYPSPTTLSTNFFISPLVLQDRDLVLKNKWGNEEVGR